MERVGRWVFNVEQSKAYDFDSSKYLEVVAALPNARPGWAVMLRDVREGLPLGILDWAESEAEAKQKLRAAVEVMSEHTVYEQRAVDSILTLLPQLLEQLERSEAWSRSIDERLERLFKRIQEVLRAIGGKAGESIEGTDAG